MGNGLHTTRRDGRDGGVRSAYSERQIPNS